MKDNIKIDLNNLINKMNTSFPDGSLTELEKARYLYIELGKYLRFDTNFVSAHEKKIRNKYWKKVDFDNIEGNEFTCRQIAEMYAVLLRRAGMDAEAIYKPEFGDDDYDFDTTGRHMYTRVNLKSGESFIADLVYDLPFIQKELQPIFFGTLTEPDFFDDITSLDQEDLKKIDEKIGYIGKQDEEKKTIAYMDDFIIMLKEDMENREYLREYVAANYSEEEAKGLTDTSSIIKYKVDAICRFFTVSDMGFREGNVFLNKLLYSFFTADERKKITCKNLISEHEDWSCLKENNYEPIVGDTDLIRCWTIRQDDGTYKYYIYEQGKNLEPIERNDLAKKLIKDGYKTICTFFKDVDNNFKSVPGFEDIDVNTDEGR